MEWSPSDDSPSQDSLAGSAIPPSTSPSHSGQDHGEGDVSAAPVNDASVTPTPPTPREEVLSNRDILTLVFEAFLPITGGPPDKATRAFLRDLALLCRSFSEPALDCLWRELHSLVPLIRLLDSAVVVDGAYYLSGSPSGLSDTFRGYAMRVRTLQITDAGSANAQDRVDAGVYVFFAQFLGGTPLLPGLNTFRFGRINDPTFSWHTLPIIFPCPSLSTVTFGGPVVENGLSHRMVLPLLVDGAPNLKSFTITDPNGATLSSYNAFFKQGIFRFHYLQSFSCTLQTVPATPIWSPSIATAPEVPQTFLEDLGRGLPNLERLTLDLKLYTEKVSGKQRRMRGTARNQSPAGTTVTTIHDPRTVCSCPLAPKKDKDYFPRLRCLDLSHRSETYFMKCSSITSVISNIGSLTLSLRQSWMPSLFEIVKELARCHLLRSLSLREDGLVTLSADDIVLLLTHINLDQLHLEVSRLSQTSIVASGLPDVPATSSIESAEYSFERIVTAATALHEDPEPLRSLTLPLVWDLGDAGLALLVHVTKKAPYMESLVVSLDSSLTTSSLASLTPNIRRPSALKFLQIRDTRRASQPFKTVEYKAIGRYLDACFPDLMSLTLHPSSDACLVDHWAHVEHLRVMYQENRRLAHALERARM